MDIETINDQLVSMGDGHIVVMMPKRKMTPDDALRHAAWLVAMAEPMASSKFSEVLKAVQNT